MHKDMDDLRKELKLVLHELRNLRQLIEDCDLCTLSKSSVRSLLSISKNFVGCVLSCFYLHSSGYDLE